MNHGHIAPGKLRWSIVTATLDGSKQTHSRQNDNMSINPTINSSMVSILYDTTTTIFGEVSRTTPRFLLFRKVMPTDASTDRDATNEWGKEQSDIVGTESFVRSLVLRPSVNGRGYGKQNAHHATTD
jgi:hypothetical protein